MNYTKNSVQICGKNHLYSVCILLIWILFLYSSIVQYKYYALPNGMLIFGSLILLVFIILLNGKKLSFVDLLTRESRLVLFYLLYMLPIGIMTSPIKDAHIAECITSLEYLFILVVVEYVIRKTGTVAFHTLLAVTALVIAAVLIREPVLYTTGRYSISLKMNPNYVGMCLTAGIWAVLFFQQKGKIPLTITFIVVSFFLYGILQTGSRKALISAGIVIGLWLVFCFLPNLGKETPGKRFLYILLLMILSLYFLRFFWNAYENSVLIDRMKRLEEEASSGERHQLYSLGWSLFSQNPLFGVGFSGFRFYYGEHSHSTIVEIPVSGGIIATIIYFASYVVSIKKCLVIWKSSRRNDKLSDVFVETKMLLVLWAVMLFYCTCIIHPGQFLSFVTFGIIFGRTAYLEQQIGEQSDVKMDSRQENCRRNGKSVYIKG